MDGVGLVLKILERLEDVGTHGTVGAPTISVESELGPLGPAGLVPTHKVGVTREDLVFNHPLHRIVNKSITNCIFSKMNERDVCESSSRSMRLLWCSMDTYFVLSIPKHGSTQK